MPYWLVVDQLNKDQKFKKLIHILTGYFFLKIYSSPAFVTAHLAAPIKDNR